MEIDVMHKVDFLPKELKSDFINTSFQNSISFKTKPKNGLDNVYQLHNIMHDNKLNYVYRGVFTSEITKKILALVEFNLIHKEESRVIKKKIFNLMIEGLQNITRHQADDKSNNRNNYGVFALKKESSKYFITTGNLVDNEIIEELTEKIETVNKLNKDELKKYYREVLMHGKISEKGGAGLGLIDMARKSGNKLLYDFEKIDNEFSYFYLHLEILSQKAEIVSKEYDKKRKLSEYTALHKILTDENVIFSFNNYFNQESMMSLLSILENKAKQSLRIQKRLYNVMVEMFQNIIKHGCNISQLDEDKTGLFYMSEDKNYYLLNTGNYIETKRIDQLTDKIEIVNSLSAAELDDLYDETMFNFDIDTNKEAGLGIIDLRLKSDQKLKYQFIKIDDRRSFYILRVAISKRIAE